MEALVRIVRRIIGGAPIVMALGCSGPRVDKEPPKASVTVAPAPVPDETDTTPKALGLFDITFYYLVGEEDVKPKAPANDNVDLELAAIAPQPQVTLHDWKTCDAIAEVTPEFASAARLQGTGKLRDGRLVNTVNRASCKCEGPCVQVINNTWGTAGTGKALQPFRTVAVDPKVIKLGSLLYIPLLEGRTMPGRAPWGGYVHDGCVTADDTGGGIDGHQLDLFVGKKAWFYSMGTAQGGSHAWARHVAVYDGNKICERKGRRVGKKQASI